MYLGRITLLAALVAVAVELLAGAAKPAAARAMSNAGGCVGERSQVGALTDAAAGRVNLVPRRTTISALGRLAVPKRPGPARIRGVELTTYRIEARLIEMRLERDGDVFLAVVDPASHATMVVEFPSPSCIGGAGARVRTLMRRARAALVAACGEPDRGSFTRVGGAATVTGVAFIGPSRAAPDAAPNGLELRPVLGFRIAACVLGAG